MILGFWMHYLPRSIGGNRLQQLRIGARPSLEALYASPHSRIISYRRHQSDLLPTSSLTYLRKVCCAAKTTFNAGPRLPSMKLLLYGLFTAQSRRRIGRSVGVLVCDLMQSWLREYGSRNGVSKSLFHTPILRRLSPLTGCPRLQLLLASCHL